MMILQQTRGGLSSGDQCSLDLPFAATKSLTARIGPTPVFTRAQSTPASTTYVGADGLIQYAAVNQPRFDHDPITGVCKGLLMEEARTNLIFQSGALEVTPWLVSGSTISANLITSPDGLLTADKLIPNSGSTTSRSAQAITLTGAHTMSVFVKSGEWTWAAITPAFVVGSVWFNLATGTVGTQNAGCVGSIVSFRNGWYRCSVTATGTGVSSTARVTATNADNAFTAGDGTSGIYAWGAHLEAGSFPTSYIPTGAGQIIRSADVCSILSLSFYNPNEGSVVGQSAITTSSASTTPELIRFGSGNDKIQIGNTNAASQAVSPAITSGGVTTYNSASGTATVGASRKIASAYKADDAISAFNGSLGTADTSVTIPSGVTTCTLFANSTGTFASLKYYRRRLPNAKLQSLTL